MAQAPVRIQERGFSVVIDPQVWYKLKRDLDTADKKWTTALRKRIRNAGAVASEAVRKRLIEGGGGEYSEDVADALAAATRVAISFSSRNAGVKVATSNRLLLESDKGLLKAYNKAEFRHPVWPGDKPRSDWSWVSQKTKPFFDETIHEVLNRELVGEIEAALQEAFDQLKERYQS